MSSPAAKNGKMFNPQVTAGRKVMKAIRFLKNPEGSSFPDIKKCLSNGVQQGKALDADDIKVFLKEAMNRGILEKNGLKYKIVEKEKRLKASTDQSKRQHRAKSEPKNKPAAKKRVIKDESKPKSMPVSKKPQIKKRSLSKSKPTAKKRVSKSRSSSKNKPAAKKRVSKYRSESRSKPVPKKHRSKERSKSKSKPVPRKHRSKERTEPKSKPVSNKRQRKDRSESKSKPVSKNRQSKDNSESTSKHTPKKQRCDKGDVIPSDEINPAVPRHKLPDGTFMENAAVMEMIS